MASSTRLSAEDRGGLSRKAYKAAQGHRRAHNDDLIKSIFGEQADHFRENPLDGPDIIGAVPKAGETSGPSGPAVQPMSADDPVAGQADWFKGSGREGESTSTPKPVAQKPQKAPSIASAVQDAANGLAVSRVLEAAEIQTGMPGDRYDQILDGFDRPPNTY